LNEINNKCNIKVFYIMRAVIQRVSYSKVHIDNTVERHIGKGLMILVGIEVEDNEEDIKWLSGKIVRLRIFKDENDMMNLDVFDIGGEIMLISQFTLHASTKKGNRPSFIKAAKQEKAIPIYLKLINQLKNDLGKNIVVGEFGSDMKVELVNDGPVTIIIDTRNKE
jgi:D-aminoacyl-tRNA deacylase